MSDLLYARRWVAAAGIVALSPVSAQHPVAVASERPRMTAEMVHALFSRPVTVQLDRVPLDRALTAIGNSAGVIIQYQGELLTTVSQKVTLRTSALSLRAALDHVLAHTGLQVIPSAKNRVTIQMSGEDLWGGTITGTITDAITRRPIRGVTVLLDDATRGVMTGEDGTFRMVNVSAGPHRIGVRLLGYGKQSKTVNVMDGQSTVIDIALQTSASALDQVVVTGTVIPAELKSVPNAMTVITAKDIEQRGITHVDQLFHGDVPGLFAQASGSNPNASLGQVTMFSRGATALSSFSGGTTAWGGSPTYTNPIKTYVDGVELADPRFLSQIDPQSIERIEILTGPQASTIYGSNAINGVMQIFTKRGTSNTPQLTLNLLSGWVENNFHSTLTPQHDYSGQISGLEGHLSYNAGGSWNYVGAWTPAQQSTRRSAFGGTRLDVTTSVGQVTTDVTLRRAMTQNQQRGDVGQPQTAYTEEGWYGYSRFTPAGLSQPQTQMLAGQTLGFTLGYAPTNWWSHEFGVGQDASDTEWRYTARGYLSVDDTTLLLDQTHTDRRSVRYTTTARVSVASGAQVTMTMGADAWQNLVMSTRVFPQTLTGALTSASYAVNRQPGHNTGGFLQTQLGVKDQFFLTYGLRAEWNPNYGPKAEPNYVPRYGIAYTHGVGALIAKLRASYGRSTRPPAPGVKAATSATDAGFWAAVLQDYGNFNRILANPEIAPEHQQGGEGGVELYWGSRGSLTVTRYNQTVDGLIDDIGPVDSIRSNTPNPSSAYWESQDADGYGYVHQFQYLNVGSIRNQGWEIQGSVNTGPFTTKSTYSWTKSRVLGITPKYRAYFANQPQYRPGATFQFLPEHTWAGAITYTHTRTAVTLNMSGTGHLTNIRNEFYLQNLYPGIRLRENRMTLNTDGYISFSNGYALTNLLASHRISSHVEGVLEIQNLANRYKNDYRADYAVMGRQSKVGLRLR